MPVDAWFESLLPVRGSSVAFDGLMVLATTLGLGVLAVVVPGHQLWVRRRRGMVLVATLAVGLVTTLVLQWLIGRPRPELNDPLLGAPGLPSFPSGHAVLAAVVVVFVGARGRSAHAVALAALAVVVGVSRVHLGHHHLTDVRGGLALGAGLGLGGATVATGSRGDPWRLRWVLWPQVGLVAAVSPAAYTGSLAEAPPAWLQVPGMDKVLHFALFGLVAFGLHFATRGRVWTLRVWRGRALAVPAAVLIPLAVAVVDEGVQALSPHRSADGVDLLADLLGLLCFWWLARWTAGPVKSATACVEHPVPGALGRQR